MKKRKNKKALTFRNVIIQLLIHFAITFSMLAIIGTVTGVIVGSSNIGGIFAWQLMFAVSIVFSVIFFFVFKINKITIFGQTTIIYVLFNIVVYLVCFSILPGLFNFRNPENVNFFLCSIAMSIFGYIIIATILLIKNKKENDNLNKYLDNFKERD